MRYAQKINARCLYNARPGNVTLQISATCDECNVIQDYCLSPLNFGNLPVYIGCTPVCDSACCIIKHTIQFIAHLQGDCENSSVCATIGPIDLPRFYESIPKQNFLQDLSIPKNIAALCHPSYNPSVCHLVIGCEAATSYDYEPKIGSDEPST